MDITVFTELEFFFRILIAGICGGLIGYERNNRLKEAGIRTRSSWLFPNTAFPT